MITQAIGLYKNAYTGLSKSTWWLALVMLINRSGTMVVPFMTMYMTQYIGVGIGKAAFVMSIFGGGAIIGALIGGGSLWLMGWTWEKLRGIEAMGLGDVKMMFMVGAYLGWRLTILTIFVGVLSGSIIGILLMARQRERNMQMLLPFGVFLGLGGIAALLFGAPVVEWYAGQFR